MALGSVGIGEQISRELSLPVTQVSRVIELLDGGDTIPFLARYRKEQTGGLDEETLRTIAARVDYLRQLTTRKEEVRRLLAEQEALTEEIAAALSAATTLQAVDDIYRPFRPKRRTRAGIARERGLEPLANWLRGRPEAGDPDQEAAAYINPDLEIMTADDALAGARDIIAELVADAPDIRQWARQHTWRYGSLETTAVDSDAETTYRQYYDYREAISKIRPHRVLAINRGERERALRVKVAIDSAPVITYLQRWLMRQGPAASPADPHLSLAAADAYQRLLAPAVERDVRQRLTEKAEAQAIRVFAANLKSLLLTPPLRGKVVMGIDPAYRTGCKVAVVDATGKLLATTVVYPTPPHNRIAPAKTELLTLVAAHGVEVIAVGNGTASRETEAFVAELIAESTQPLAYVIVNEAGASVYSASKLARDEFPDLDVAERSAVSIARRLQDPLAELVKIEPQSIGVGQYQHDVAPKELACALNDVVESAVNAVGVNVNTASVPLLAYVAGLSTTVAANIVKRRETAGPFRQRNDLASVPRLGPKTFEQCAGFLRVPESENPLDNTPIHPESYEATVRFLNELGYEPADVTGPKREQLRRTLTGLTEQQVGNWAERLQIGRPTLTDIIEALQRPGLDPRDDLPAPALRTDVITLDDLTPGMVLQGTVRNVVDFGAFVDIGVQQDGLVHISEMSERYIRHPLDAVSVGDVVPVRVLDVDRERQRVSLSMKGVN